jgi:hydrogenase assembly chaperone HypC/HupF
MCLGIPMQILEIDAASGGTFAWAEGEGLDGSRRHERLNILWIDGVAAGDWVYAVLGQARERLTVERAEEVRRALRGLAAALAGDQHAADAGFADLLVPAVSKAP